MSSSFDIQFANWQQCANRRISNFAFCVSSNCLHHNHKLDSLKNWQNDANNAKCAQNVAAKSFCAALFCCDKDHTVRFAWQTQIAWWLHMTAKTLSTVSLCMCNMALSVTCSVFGTCSCPWDIQGHLAQQWKWCRWRKLYCKFHSKAVIYIICIVLLRVPEERCK